MIILMVNPKKVNKEILWPLLIKMDKIFIIPQNITTIKMPLSIFSFLNKKVKNRKENTITNRMSLLANVDAVAVYKIKIVSNTKSILVICSLLVCNCLILMLYNIS